MAARCIAWCKSRACSRIHNCGLVFRNRPSRKAMSAVTPRFPTTADRLSAHRVVHWTTQCSSDIFTEMPTGRSNRVEVLQGTLDLILLRALSTMGPQHAYRLAARLEQVSIDPFTLNQGTLYTALIRLEQRGWIRGAAGRGRTPTETPEYLSLTPSGARALTARRRFARRRFSPDLSKDSW